MKFNELYNSTNARRRQADLLDMTPREYAQALRSLQEWGIIAFDGEEIILSIPALAGKEKAAEATASSIPGGHR